MDHHPRRPIGRIRPLEAARPAGLLAGALAVAVVLLLPSVAMGAPQTFTVTNTADSGKGTLRAAVNLANNNDNPGDIDRIAFAPGVVGKTITLQSSLWTLLEPVTIDGCSSVPTSVNPCVGLRAADSVARDFHGFVVDFPLSQIRGLAISNMATGVRVFPEGIAAAVRNCWIGLRLDGSTEGNDDGVSVELTTGVNIGGSSRADRNVIVASNPGSGVQVLGSAFTSIRGNLIGTNAAGARLGNSQYGVRIVSFLGEAATDNVVGGDTAGAENVISNSGRSAVFVQGPDAVRNLLLRTRGDRNNGLFFDLWPAGEGAQPPDSPNRGIQRPRIQTATTEAASGTAEPNARVRLFRRAGSGAARLDAFVARVTADGTGHWSAGYPSLPPGGFLTATQTASGKGSSELSGSFAYATAP